MNDTIKTTVLNQKPFFGKNKKVLDYEFLITIEAKVLQEEYQVSFNSYNEPGLIHKTSSLCKYTNSLNIAEWFELFAESKVEIMQLK